MSRCFSCDPSFGCFTAGSCRKGEPELRATISTLTEERDDLSTRLATAQRERDEARGECERLRGELQAFKVAAVEHLHLDMQDVVGGSNGRDAVRHETAEAIAAFVDAEAETRREEGFSYRAVSELAAAIRSNAWRPSPATDKEEP